MANRYFSSVVVQSESEAGGKLFLYDVIAQTGEK